MSPHSADWMEWDQTIHSLLLSVFNNVEDWLTNGTTGEERTNPPVPMSVLIQNYLERPQSGLIIFLLTGLIFQERPWLVLEWRIFLAHKQPTHKQWPMANSRLCLHSSQIIKLMISVFISLLCQVVLSVIFIFIHFLSISASFSFSFFSFYFNFRTYKVNVQAGIV